MRDTRYNIAPKLTSSNAQMNLFFETHAALVKDPARYAREVIINHGKMQWGIDLDPDATVIATLAYNAPPGQVPYPATLMHSLSLTQAMLSNWQRQGNGEFFSLLHHVEHRPGGIPMTIVDKLNLFFTAHYYEGLYLACTPQTYDALTHINVAPADFKKFVWEKQLRTEYHHYLQNFWAKHAQFYPNLGKASFVKAVFLQVMEKSLSEEDKYLALKMAGIGPAQTWETLTPDHLGNWASVEQGVEVAPLMIYRYTASDLLTIKDTYTGRLLLYIPGNSSPIHSFDNEQRLQDWIGEQCRDPLKRRALEGHFKEVDDSDGLFLSGLHSALDGMAVYPRILNGATGTWPPRHIVRAGPMIIGDPFVFLYHSIRQRLDSDAISMIQTQGDYRKEVIAQSVSNSLVLAGFVAMVAPEAAAVIVGLSAALIGLGVDQMLEARTLQARQAGGSRVVFGVLNALPFIVEQGVTAAVALSDVRRATDAAERVVAATEVIEADAPTAPSVEHTPAALETMPAAIAAFEPPTLRSLRPQVRRALRAFEAPPEAWQGLPNVRDANGNLTIYGHHDQHFVKLFDKGYRVRRSQSVDGWRVIDADGKPGPYVKPLADGQWDIDLHGLKGGGAGRPPVSVGTVVAREASLSAQVQRLYPSFSRQQINLFINELRISGTALEIQLARLETDYDALIRSLDKWLVAPPELVQVSAQRAMMVSRSARRQAADIIKRCWRRETPVTGQAAANYLGGYELDLTGIKISHLPQLPGDFSHVTVLNLERTSITERSASALIRTCPEVRWVKLECNFLTAVPEGIRDLPRLTRLMLADNQIVLSPNAVRTITGIQTLRLLNLNGNPIGPLLDVTPMRRLINLFLRNTGIDAVPEGACELERLTYLDLRGNQITHLPEAYYEIPMHMRRGLLDGNPLSPETLRRLIRPAMRYVPESGARVWLQTTADAARAARQSAWSVFEQEPQSAEFFSVINHLRQSADFSVVPAAVTERVWQILEAGAGDQALRERLIGMAARPETCVDGATVIFSHMELEVRVTRARSLAVDGNGGRQLLTLARGLYRLEQVDNMARLDVSSRVAGAAGFREDVEVVLAYRIGLAESLELPISTRHMVFTRIARVSDEAINAARLAVLTAETDAALIDFAVSRDFWVKYLEAEYPEELAATRLPTQQAMGDLDDESSALTDAAYTRAVDEIVRQRVADEAALMRQLTQAELANGPGANAVS